MGNVVLVNGKDFGEWQEWKISLSYKIGQLFRSNGYNRELTMHSDIYKTYSDIVLNNIADQKYSVNPFAIKADVFHNKMEIEIAKILASPCSVVEIAKKLAETFSYTDGNLRFEIERIIVRFIVEEMIVPL